MPRVGPSALHQSSSVSPSPRGMPSSPAELQSGALAWATTGLPLIPSLHKLCPSAYDDLRRLKEEELHALLFKSSQNKTEVNTRDVEIRNEE